MIFKRYIALCGVLALMPLSVCGIKESTVAFSMTAPGKRLVPAALREATYVIPVGTDLYRCVSLTQTEKNIIIAAIKSDTKIKSYSEKIDQKLIDRLVKNNKANSTLITKVFTDFKGKAISELHSKMIAPNRTLDAPWEAV